MESLPSGTILYQAPEITGKDKFVIKTSMDIWALGATFHEMLTATSLFGSKTEAEICANIVGFQSYKTYVKCCEGAEESPHKY